KATLALLCEVAKISPEAWRERRAPWEPPDGDFADAWRADPGLRPHPCDGDSPHAFGGDLLRMPPCPGCGHTLHAFFLFDVEADPALGALLPGWRFLPFVGCIDCAAWLVRRDLRVGDDAVELLSGHAAGFEAHGEPLARLPRRAVELRPI